MGAFLLGFLLLSLLFAFVDSTHFAYGSHYWNLIPNASPYVPVNALGNATTARTYQIFNVLGYRRSYPWSPANPNVGQTVYPGNLLFYPMGSYSGGALENQNVALTVLTLFLSDDWFMGGYNTTFTTGKYSSSYFASHWRTYFSACCRLSSIRDHNNDVSWTITGIMNRWSTLSPQAAGLPRIYVQQFYPLQYQVPFINGKDVVIISLAAKLDSTLTNPIPIDPPLPRNSSFQYDISSGTCYWTPQVTGLYAIQFLIEENCTSEGHGDVPCANRTLQGTGNNGGSGTTAPNCCTRIPLDFVFEVDPGCNGQPNCVPPPYFIQPFNQLTTNPSSWVWYFYRGVTGSFQVCATDDNSNQTTLIDFGLSPTTSSLTLTYQAQTTCYLFSWAPGITDTDTYLCAVATAIPGYRQNPLKSQGSYCIKLIIIDVPILIVSGIVRDFHWYHPNFNRSYADCIWCTPAKANWLQPSLDVNHMPVYKIGSGTLSTWSSGLSLASNTTAGFYDWYTTDLVNTPPRNVQVVVPIILSSGVNINAAIFTFLSTAFFPIDNEGFGNEGMSHNYFYTYELNVYITYTSAADGGGVEQILNVAAADDLWIFIDNIIPANWNQHGIKPANATSGVPYGFSVNMSSLLGSNGLPLVSTETYRCDIFYANRFNTPYLQIELPNNTLCTQLSSGVYIFNWTSFAGVSLVNGFTTSSPPSNSLVYYAPTSGPVPLIGAITRPSTGASVQGLKIFDQLAQGPEKVCYATPLKALHGFVASFTFFVNNPNHNVLDGFAFVLDSYSTSIQGGGGANLGYGGTQKTLAIEFDMVASAIFSDPNFVTCCGAFPYWDQVQTGFASSVLPYGQVALHANLVPVGGSYQANCADESSSGCLLLSGSSLGGINLDFKNGSEYNTKIVYQPAADDGTSAPQPGWFWVYENAQLEPVVATQVDGVLLRNMLGGATSFCFTSSGQYDTSTNSNPSGYGADIWLLNYGVLVVPTDPQSTSIISAGIVGEPTVNGATSPISPVIAGQTAQVTVQTRDACGNDISVGGELNLFVCTVSKPTCPGAPINCTGVDNGDGTYTFSYLPTIAANNYQLAIQFSNYSIKSSPFPFAVVAAPASVITSVAVFGQLPELLSNAGSDPFDGILKTEGVFAVRFSMYGRVVAYKVFDFLNAVDSYNGGAGGGANLVSFLGTAQSGEYIAIAVAGSQITTTQISAAASTLTALGASKFGSIQPGNSYVFIARKGLPLPLCVPSCEMLSTAGKANITAPGIDNSSISFTRYFNITAASANDACGPDADINAVFADIRVPAGSNNQFTIQARDIYGNLNPTTLVAASFSPDLTPATGGSLTASSLFPLTGYFYYPFYSTKAGNYYVYTGLDSAGENINYGSGPPYGPYPVKIDPGLANLTNSFCQGSVLTSTAAGSWATVELDLYDRWNNPIAFENPYDNISATLVFANNNSVLLHLNLSWQDGPACTKCVLYGSFFPTIASVLPGLAFNILLNINGEVGSCGSPDIVPGPLSPANCSFDLSTVTPNPSPAGSTASFVIQARDRYGNARITPNSPDDGFAVSFAPAVTGYSIQYAGNGQYLVTFVPTVKGNDTVKVVVVSNGLGDVPTAGNYTVGTQPLRVIPGAAGVPSVYSGISSTTTVVAGTLNSFTVTSYDQYSNLRNNQPYGIAVASASDYYYRLFEPVKQIDALIYLNTAAQPLYNVSGNFTVLYNATLVGNYSAAIQTVPGGQAITGTPVNYIQVIPACTYPPNTLISGAGTGGGVAGTSVNFSVAARDIFTNPKNDFLDKNDYNISTVLGSQTPVIGTIQNGPTPGTYVAVYQVPANSGSTPINFTVTLCHNGKNGTSGQTCFPSWCQSFLAYAVNGLVTYWGNITVANGTAGTTSYWLIDDQQQNGAASTAATGVVSSWTVTVTRVSDGAAAAPAIAVACVQNVPGTCLIASPRTQSNVSFEPTTNIGYFQVHVYAYGVETNQSKDGIFVWINPGPVYPPNCQVFGLSATIGAGSSGTFQVALRDQWFHNITSGVQIVKANATLSSASLSATITGVWNGATQEFGFTYQLNATGTWPVSIWETVSFVAALTAGETIGSGLTITVTPGQASCLTSYVLGVTLASTGTAFGTAGQQSAFTIVPLDVYGNPVTNRSTNATITDSSGNATFTQVVQSASVPPAIEIAVLYTPIKVVPTGNVITVEFGSPACNLNGTKPQLNDPTPQQSPLTVTINPGAIFPPLSTVSGWSPSIVAGNPLNLTLTLKDMYGNSWFSDQGSQLTAFANIPASTSGPASQLGAVVAAQGSGVYTFTLGGQSTHLASEWNGTGYDYDYGWSVSATGTPITGTGASLLNVPNSQVIADVTSPPNTLAPTLVTITADVPQSYTVTLQDQYGNRKYEGADSDQVVFTWMNGTIDCTPGETIPPSTSTVITTLSSHNLGQGVVNVTIIGSTIGYYTLNLTVTPAGLPTGWYGAPNCIPTSKLVEQILPGAASPPNSWWTINSQNFTAGDTAIIFAQVRDKDNNDIGRTGTVMALGSSLIPGVSGSFPANGPDVWTLTSGWTLVQYPTNWVDPDFKGTTPSLPITPGQAPTLGSQVDYGNSSYMYSITLYKAGLNQPVVLSMVNATGSWVAVPWPANLAMDAAIDVYPGPPRQFSPTTAQVVAQLTNTSTTEAMPTSFILTAYDNYGNLLTNTNANFTVVMQQQSNGYTIPVTSTPGPGAGQTTFSFTSAWAGPFTVLIVMNPGDGTADIVSPSATLNVAHATCAYLTPATPYRCLDRTCVAAYSDCASLPGGLGNDTCFSAGTLTCSTGGCAATVSACPCPTGQFRCPLGNCVAGTTDANCPSAATACPAGQTLCSTGTCAASTADCPSQGVCAPGYVVCPSGVSCATDASTCPDTTTVCDAGKFACPTGSCVSSSADCPTPVSCGTNMVLCLSDGSCQTDRSKCPDQYPCYAPNTYRCPSSAMCTTGLDQCPSSVTCPSGYVKCQDQTCATDVSTCAVPLPCGLNQTVCADGSCENNLLFCPALVSCPTDTAVLCWDKSCVEYVSECSVPQSCPNVTCPGGVCALTFSLCPTGTTCPTSYPVLCGDGSCQNSTALCVAIAACPVNTPYRCPDGQSCRGALVDCPTIVSCPSTLVKCPDGTCNLALDKCAPVVNCPTGTSRCPGGGCVTGSTSLCPTPETCTQGFAKCLDGSCRNTCPTTYQTCATGLVTCPQAAAGVDCATSLTQCPQQPTCNPAYPVRCSDSSCVTTVSNCPTPPTTFPNNKIPCGDGTWASDISSCPTPVTCPASTPAKCTDNTCRVAAADCPVTKLCSASTPYLCSTGACVATPWDAACTSSSIPCATATPIACAPYGSGLPCVANASDCTSVPLNGSGSTATVCGPHQTYCRSGVCVNDDTQCPAVTCDSAFPYLCPDGECTSGVSSCNSPTTGCPGTQQRCDFTGLCVDSVTNTAECALTNKTTPCPNNVYCSDSSCPTTSGAAIPGSNCPLANGCGGPNNLHLDYRCYDGTCVGDISDCTSAAVTATSQGNYPAVCAPSTPYECADGYCAKTSIACPPQLVNLGCTGKTAFQCASGTCVASSIECPPVNQVCGPGLQRCNDGTCRANVTGACPSYTACPYRCSNGLCASTSSECDIDPFSGCPGGNVKCNLTGQCAASLSSCITLPAASGCSVAAPIKCYSGQCSTSQSLCPLPNNCPSNATYRCADGTCAATSGSCGTSNVCGPSTPIRCADSSCAATAASCTAVNGCPVTTPFRCADGTCSQYAASSGEPGACSATVTCTGTSVLCADGSCVAQASYCTPLFCQAGLVYCNFGCYTNSSCSSTTTVCPTSSPILCIDGACVGETAMCGTSSTGGPANQLCTSSQQTCSDGSCASSLSTCITTAQEVLNPGGTALSPTTTSSANAACGSGQTMCPDGVCVPSAKDYTCLIIPACPLGQYRWWNGDCLNSTSGPSTVNCASNLIRCEDGYCREKKLGYDGCGLLRPYHCPNRECATTPSGCTQAALGNPLYFPATNVVQYRRLLGSTIPACNVPAQCNAQIHAALIDATVDVTATQYIDVALNSDLVVVGSLKIPSGAFVLNNGASKTTISIRPVPASRMRYAVNEIVPSRQQAYGSYFPFSNTVLSVPFECYLGPDVDPIFAIEVTYTAWIDQIAYIGTSYQDVCLARLIELQGFSTWECLIDDAGDRNSSSLYYVHQSGDPNQQVESVFNTCQPSSAPGVLSPYNGTVYAFIWSPVPVNPTAPAGLDVVQRNIVWIILGILLGLAVLVLLAYCAFRLFRYREKYHTEREEADRLQEEVENMRQFGGDSGNKDDQVAMTANPLAVQLKDVQARYNEEELKLQQAEASLRKEEGDIRAQHIDNMRDNRNKLAQELEKLKQQLAEAQASSAPVAAFEETESAPAFTGDEPVREFDTSSTAAPKRMKKDL